MLTRLRDSLTARATHRTVIELDPPHMGAPAPEESTRKESGGTEFERSAPYTSTVHSYLGQFYYVPPRVALRQPSGNASFSHLLCLPVCE